MERQDSADQDHQPQRRAGLCFRHGRRHPLGGRPGGPNHQPELRRVSAPDHQFSSRVRPQQECPAVHERREREPEHLVVSGLLVLRACGSYDLQRHALVVQQLRDADRRGGPRVEHLHHLPVRQLLMGERDVVRIADRRGRWRFDAERQSVAECRRTRKPAVQHVRRSWGGRRGFGLRPWASQRL